MNTALNASLAVVALGLAGATTLYAVRCWPRWSRGDRINYAIMSAAVWPWVIAGCFVTVPTAYTRTVIVVGGSALVVFLVRQALWLRHAQRELARLQDHAAQWLAGDGMCPDSVREIHHAPHEWIPGSGLRSTCRGYPAQPGAAAEPGF